MANPSVRPAEPDGLAVALTVSAQIGDKRSIVAQTYIARDCEIEEYHNIIDKLACAIDRQEAKYKLKELKIALEQHHKFKGQLLEDYLRIETKNAEEWKRRGKKGDPELSTTERAAKATAETNVRRYETEILKIEAEIKACEAIIGGV